MASEGRERAGAVGGSDVARLAAVLAAGAGTGAGGEAGPTSREIAELLWFAGKLGEGSGGEGGAGAPAPPTPPGHTHHDTGTATDFTPDPIAAPPPTPPHDPPPDDRVPLHLPAPNPRGTRPPLLAPAPAMLPHPLALQRALRPLKRKVPSPRVRLLDEHATADRIARLGGRPDVWLPVLRPAPDRWLRLNLVYDTGPTMPVWRPLVRELHTTLAQSGVFRTVTVHRATPDGRAHHVPALADGRTVTLIVSDCMGPQWRPGPAGDRWHRTLRRWAGRMPLAVVQPLPEHLWHTTALPAAPGLLTAPAAAAPSAALTFLPYEDEAQKPPAGAVPLPVLEPAPAWLANWAALVAAPGGGRAPGALAWLPPTPVPPAEPAPDIAELPVSDLVLRFRATASPEAFRIAGHLALANPSLPVMRLVQRALDGSPRPQHLAEIILSGLLTAVAGPPGSYEFRPGVRQLLLRSLPRTARTRTREFLARVGGLIDERAGLAAGEFGAEPGRDAERAFATVRAETVRRLGGEAVGGLVDGTEERPAGETAQPPAGETKGRPSGETADGPVHVTTREPGRGTEPPRATGERRGRLGDDAAEWQDHELVGGRYRLVRQRGANQRVWAAVDVRSDRRVAVHLYGPQAAPQDRFLREAGTLAGLAHPNLASVIDFGVQDSRPYLVAEFVDGVTLAELMQGSGRGISFRVFARLVRDVTRGLDALHERGLVRGQLGWDGLLLRPDGQVVLSRFELGELSEAHSPYSDFTQFRLLLQDLTVDATDDLPFRPALARLADYHSPASAVRQLALSDDSDPAKGDAERLSITLLGPPRIRLAGSSADAPSPEAQALLCMLLLHQGRRVGFAALAEGLWEDPPSTTEALRRCHDLAGELRRFLGPCTLAELADGGYALHLPDDYVDVHHCEQLLGGRTDDMTPRTRYSLIQEALSLFYGDPLDGIPGPAAQATRARLRTLRLTLCATRAELDLELGDFERAATDLAALVREHPEREEFRRLHILALKGTGRVAEAVEAYESYSEVHGSPVDAALHQLYLELRATRERGRLTILFEAPALDQRPDARDTLGRAVTQLLSRGDLASHQFEVLTRDNGYAVLTEPDAFVLPALLRNLPAALMEVADPPPLRVAFWHTPWFTDSNRRVVPDEVQAALDTADTDLLVVVSSYLYEQYADSSATIGTAHFQPLRTGERPGAPLAWYSTPDLPRRVPDEEAQDLVRGPFTTPDTGRLAAPDPGRTAVVLAPSDGSMTVLFPNHPLAQRPPLRTTYYEVDLTVHRSGTVVSLPASAGGSFAATVELSWHVEDPVAFLRGEATDIPDLLLRHVATEASRITRRYPLRRVGAAQQALRTRLRHGPVPGLSVTYSIQLTGEAPPVPGIQHLPPVQQQPSTPPPATALLHNAEVVLLGFDGPLTRPFSRKTARDAALDLLSLVVENRDPEDALAGRPLTSTAVSGEPVHPLEVLRAFADSGLAPLLRERLDQLELRAAAESRSTQGAAELVQALRVAGRPMAVVSNFSAEAVRRHLEHVGLPLRAIFGRGTLLMPDPQCLRLAQGHFMQPARSVLITSTAAEVTAALRLDLPVIGYADSPLTRTDLLEAGCDLIVDSLQPLLDAARSL
ncbi:SAV_2336 N-terminal domain-related protein [Streptomyces lanatus]|uniref:SAV_2336 N-terminal domain-related protein n=1 Tax=Streptomyces lanatus TaxID=66900 RepID=A0ABV1XJ09_9ACTN|nr:SAV_2336 N-terminal domain-related protein [Streptomyces lanatus]GHG91662.1 hypothetical protein GCM10018780_12420 [Streptomyces lanatus]